MLGFLTKFVWSVAFVALLFSFQLKQVEANQCEMIVSRGKIGHVEGHMTGRMVMPIDFLEGGWPDIPGAEWTLCNCNILTVEGGKVMPPLHFGVSPIRRSQIRRIVFTDEITILPRRVSFQPMQSLDRFFANFPALEEVTGLHFLDMTYVGCVSRMFSDTSSLSNLPDIDQLDVSRVRNFYSMFERSGITTLDLNGWDTSSMENTRNMFANSNVTFLHVNRWDVSNLMNADRMFFNIPLVALNLYNWHTPNLRSANSMMQMPLLVELNITNFDFRRAPSDIFFQVPDTLVFLTVGSNFFASNELMHIASTEPREYAFAWVNVHDSNHVITSSDSLARGFQALGYSATTWTEFYSRGRAGRIIPTITWHRALVTF